MAKVEDICRRHGALLISDEVICGFGRTGEPFGFQHYGVSPDIVTMAKGITSAYLPLSATAVKREIFEAYSGGEPYGRFRHVNTFEAIRACALALKKPAIDGGRKSDRPLPELGERSPVSLSRSENIRRSEMYGARAFLPALSSSRTKSRRNPLMPPLCKDVITVCREKGLLVGKMAIL